MNPTLPYCILVSICFIAIALRSLWRGGNGVRLALALMFSILAFEIRSFSQNPGSVYPGNPGSPALRIVRVRLPSGQIVAVMASGLSVFLAAHPGSEVVR